MEFQAFAALLSIICFLVAIGLGLYLLMGAGWGAVVALLVVAWLLFWVASE